MKHTLKVTLMLALFFLIAQGVGLVIVSQYVDIGKSSEAGKSIPTEVAANSPGGAPPEVEQEDIWKYAIYLISAIIFGTLIVLILIKFKMVRSMKAWFLIGITICLAKAIYPFIFHILTLMSVASWATATAIMLAGVMAYFKIFRSNILVHNLGEILLYGGLASFIVPILNVQWAAIVLVVISLYDMFAVWKSKHMIKMAKFQTEARTFAGLFIPYDKQDRIHVSLDTKLESKDDGKRNAILGGGDIAFPLLFSGTVLQATAMVLAPAIITITTTIALFLLLYKSKPNKFYPAMPFISAGCFVGYAIVLLV